MFLPALDLLSVSEMCVSVPKKLCRTTNAKQGPLRGSREVCFCLGRPGLQQYDRPSRPQGAWGQPCTRPAGVTQAVPRALCRLMEGSCLQVLFGVDLRHLHLPLPGHFL